MSARVTSRAGIVLTNNCTDTAWFAIFASVAEAWCFLDPRVKFWHPEKDGSSPLVGQVLTYAGPDRAAFCRRLFAMGLVVVRP